jgi:hypothetical protein
MINSCFAAFAQWPFRHRSGRKAIIFSGRAKATVSPQFQAVPFSSLAFPTAFTHETLMDFPLQNRRRFLQHSLAVSAGFATPAYLAPIAARADEPPIQLGSRRELLVDDFLIDRLEGVALTLHKPEAREVVLTCDAPWEGNTSGYFTVFEDEGRFRMYYRGWHFDPATKKAAHVDSTCLAESRDGRSQGALQGAREGQSASGRQEELGAPGVWVA